MDHECPWGQYSCLVKVSSRKTTPAPTFPSDSLDPSVHMTTHRLSGGVHPLPHRGPGGDVLPASITGEFMLEKRSPVSGSLGLISGGAHVALGLCLMSMPDFLSISMLDLRIVLDMWSSLISSSRVEKYEFDTISCSWLTVRGSMSGRAIVAMICIALAMM